MPRFVLLTHDHPVWHWDLMLERDGVLHTWRLNAEPLSTCRIIAMPLPDHRLMYLEYEGPVSQHRGTVQRWDHGEYEVVCEVGSVLELVLRGTLLRGHARLVTEADGTAYFQFVADGLE